MAEAGPAKNAINHGEAKEMKLTRRKPMVIMGNFIHSISIDKFEVVDQNGLMIINSHGIIVSLESSSEPWTEQRLKEKLKSFLTEECIEDELRHSVDLICLRRGEFFVPGFIDTHTHAVQYQNIGIGQQYQRLLSYLCFHLQDNSWKIDHVFNTFRKNSPVLDWLKNVTFPEELRFEDELYAKRMFEKVVSRLIQVGTTTCCYFSSIHLGAAKVLATVCCRAGQRAFIGKCNMDRNDSDERYKEASTEQSLHDTIQFIDFFRNELPTTCCNSSEEKLNDNCIRAIAPENKNSAMVQPILTPRFAISCTEKLMRGLGELMKADPSLRLQTHLDENLSEIKFTKSLFPGYSTYSEIYDAFGLLSRQTILAHCIYLEPSEVKLLTERDCGLSHCPTSNFNLSSGICQVKTLLKSGIGKIGLGTDVSGGFGVGILTTIRDAASAAKASTFSKQDEVPQSNQLSIENLLYLATLGGARVCNLEHKIGNFEIGKEFDALLIQTGAGPDPTPMNKPNVNDGNSTDKFTDWMLSSRSKPYEEGLNPSFFIDNQAEEVDLRKLFEKFLFTGDDRNIGSVFINSTVVGGSRPI